jgi:hypothetical protein
MSAHPSHEALFASATVEDPAVSAHVQTCAPCAARLARLRAGASLLAQVRTDTAAPSVNWSALDPVLATAAESAAQAARSGARPAVRRIEARVLVGVALAAAAVGVFALRSETAPVSQPAPTLAMREPSERGAGEARPSVPEAIQAEAPSAPVAQPVEGVVLMVAAPVAYSEPGARATALRASTRVHQGARIVASARGGRAVVALHAGYRVDARAGADLTLARLSTTETSLALTKGEARVEGPAPEEARLVVQAQGWTLRAKGGAFVAKIDRDRVRVHVVSGKLGVQREGSEEREALAGEELELGMDTPSYRVLSHEARDEQAIDLSMFAHDGQEFTVPAVPSRAEVTAQDYGVLPSGVTAVRIARALMLSAQVGSESWALLLDPAAPAAPTAWSRTARSTSVASSARGGTAASSEPAAAPVVPVAITARAVFAASTRTSVDSLPDTEQAASQLWAQQFASRAASCFRECGPGSGCDGVSTIELTLETNSDGTVSTARANHSAPALNRCLSDAAHVSRLPRPLTSRPVYVNLVRTSP